MTQIEKDHPMTMADNKPGFDGPNFDTYIGDAVYAAFEREMVILRVNRHDSTPLVYLDDVTWDRLVAWRARVVNFREGAAER